MAISVLYSVEADHLFVLYNVFLFGRSKKLDFTYEQCGNHILHITNNITD